jgi:hypothetical protein
VKVDYLKQKQKARRQRFLFVLLAFLAGLTILLASSISKYASTDIQKLPQIQESQTNSENWQEIVQALDRIRATAIMQRDKSQLAAVYVEGSQLDTGDFELIDQLVDSNSHVHGLQFEVEDIQKISHRWSNDEEVVELEVTDSRSQYVLQNELGKLTIPKRESITWLISLSRRGDSWLISNAEQVLNDS